MQCKKRELEKRNEMYKNKIYRQSEVEEYVWNQSSHVSRSNSFSDSESSSAMELLLPVSSTTGAQNTSCEADLILDDHDWTFSQMSSRWVLHHRSTGASAEKFWSHIFYSHIADKQHTKA